MDSIIYGIQALMDVNSTVFAQMFPGAVQLCVLDYSQDYMGRLISSTC